jgi:hypothetical protein
MADEFTEGKNSEQGSPESGIELIYAEKNLGIYLAEAYENIKRAIFAATCKLSLSARAVFACYDAHAGFSYPGRLGGKQIAELCGVSMGTYYKAKKELLEAGLLFRMSKASANHPDRIYVSDVLHERFVSQNLVNGNSVNQNLTNGEATYGCIDGTQTQAKPLKTLIIKKLPKALQVSYTSSTTSKESDPYALDVAFDETPIVTHEELDEVFSDPLPTVKELWAERNDYLVNREVELIEEVEGSTKKLPSFKLTPPGSLDVKRLPEKRIPKKYRASRPIPNEMLSQMVKFCWGIETTQQWVAVDRVMIGKCSDAIAKLVGMGADLTQFSEFVKRWREHGWKKHPAPDSVVRNWFKVMGTEKKSRVNKVEQIAAIADAVTHTSDEMFRVNRMLFIQGLERMKIPDEKRPGMIARWEAENRGGAQ